MEALTLTLDCLAMVLMVYMSIRDEGRRVGARTASLFRTIDDEADDGAAGDAPGGNAAAGSATAGSAPGGNAPGGARAAGNRAGGRPGPVQPPPRTYAR